MEISHDLRRGFGQLPLIRKWNYLSLVIVLVCSLCMYGLDTCWILFNKKALWVVSKLNTRVAFYEASSVESGSCPNDALGWIMGLNLIMRPLLIFGSMKQKAMIDEYWLSDSCRIIPAVFISNASSKISFFLAFRWRWLNLSPYDDLL